MIFPAVAVAMLALALPQQQAFGQPARTFLHKAIRATDQPLLGADAPDFSLLIASRDPQVEPAREAGTWRLTIGDIPLRLELSNERLGGIDLYRIRHAKDSAMRAEQIRFSWTFPAAYNESMTFDAGALQGQPLYLPNGKLPDNQFTNWGSLFYNRAVIWWWVRRSMGQRDHAMRGAATRASQVNRRCS